MLAGEYYYEVRGECHDGPQYMTETSRHQKNQRIGAYPGSFNPPTLAHLGIAAAARDQRSLHRVDLVISRRALDKEDVMVPSLADRVTVLEQSVAQLPWLTVVVTDDQLLADISQDYDVLIMGGDKWAQLHELRYYDSPDHMASCLARLPELAIANRPPHDDISPDALLAVDPDFVDVSSSAARAGELAWMTPAARSFAERHGGWPAP